MDSLVKKGSVASVAWSRSTTTATITQAGHGLVTGDTVNVTVTSDVLAITVSTKTVTYISPTQYSFTCLNGGAATGTITVNHIDNYLINGGTLTVDSHTRWGKGQNLYAGLGNIAMSATLGGNVEFKADNIRLITFTSGTTTVPALGTVISQGSAQGEVMGVYTALNATTTTEGLPMPTALGYLLIKNWNGISFASGVLTGISCKSKGVDTGGWLEIVGVDGFTATVNRLNNFKVTGGWFDFLGTTTTGTRTTTYQIPTHGSTVNYFPGVWVETGTSTGLYEFYPCAGSRTALIANIATDIYRGKFCWVETTTGLVRFGHDGTNSTGGYCPPSGRKIRIPNIFFLNCTAAAPTVNVLPNATLATRYKFSTTLAGVIDISNCCMNWNATFTQPYSVNLSNVAIMTQLLVQEIAAPITWSHVGIGQEAANTQNALSMVLCLAGGTMDNCTWTRASAIATSTNIMTDVDGLTITNERTCNILLRTGAATTHVLTRVNNCTWDTTLVGNGTISLSTCTNLTFSHTSYYDPVGATGATTPQTTTGTANPLYLFSLLLSCSYITIDGIDFCGLPLVQPYSGILNLGAAGNSNIKLLNLGTPAAPLDMGGDKVTATWTQSTTTATATKTAHGLKVGDIFYVEVSSNISIITVGTKTVASVPSVNTFTFTCLTGSLTGSIVYYPTMAANLVNIVAGHNGANIKIQRCYCPHLRTNLITQGDNSTKGVKLESVFGDFINAPTSISLNQYNRQLQCTHPLAVQNSVYGTHWLDQYTTGGDICTNKGYTQVTTTATITSVAHGLRTNDLINVYASSNTAIIPLGQKTITAVTIDTFTFACTTGSTTGTISYKPLHGRIAIQMNEPTTETVSQVSLGSSVNFTSAGALFMPIKGNTATFTSPVNIVGHTGFPIAEAVMATSPITNFDIKYSMNNGSSYKNLSYSRFPSPMTVNGATATYPKIVKMNSTQSLMTWIESTFIYGVVVTESSGFVTLGRTTQLTTAATTYTAQARLTDTLAVVAYRNASTFLETKTLTINGTEIIIGNTLVVNAVATTNIALTPMSSTQAIVVYAGTSAYLQACTLDLNGTDLTNGTILNVNAVASTYMAATTLSDTQAVVTYRGTTSYAQACTLNVSGTTLTNGTVYSINAVASTYMSIVTMSTTQVMVAYVGTSSYVQIAVLDITGGTSLILKYAVNSVNASVSTYTGLAALTSTTAVVTYIPSSTFLNSTVCTIGAGSTTFGSLVALNAVASTENWLTGLTSTKVLCAFQGNGFRLQLRIIDVAGTTVSSITESTTGGSTVTLADGIGDVAVGDYVFGTGIAGNAKVTTISGSRITLDSVHTAYIYGYLRFNQLPNETVSDALVGFPLKLKFTTNIGNIIGIPSLYFFTNYTSASKLANYPLDTYSFTLTGLVTNSEVRCYTGTDPATSVEIGSVENSTDTFNFSHSSPGVAGYIVVFALGYQAWRLDYTYLAENVSIPIQQILDRQYNNPT